MNSIDSFVKVGFRVSNPRELSKSFVKDLGRFLDLDNILVK